MDSRPTDPGEAPLPGWVTISEAAFVARRERHSIAAAIANGLVRTRRVGGRGKRAFILVRTTDVVALVTGSGVEGRPGPTPVSVRPRRSVRIAATVTGVFLIAAAVGRQLMLAAHVPSRPNVFEAPPTLSVEPGAAVTTGSSPIDAREIRPPGRGTRPLRVGSVEWVRKGGWVTASVTILDRDRAWWLAEAWIDFEAVDAAGVVVARYRAEVEAGPGERVIAVAPALLLDDGVGLGSVAARVAWARWRPARAFARAPAIDMSRPKVLTTGAVTGRISVERSARPIAVRVSCILLKGTSPVAIAEGSIGRVGTRPSRFRVSAPFVAAQPDGATCSAVPAG